MTYTRRRKAPMRKKPAFKRRARSSRGTSVASVKRIVKSQLAKTIEKKTADPIFSPINTTIDFASNNGVGFAGWQALDMTPTIPTGSGQNQRIGNKLGITSGYIKLQFEGQDRQFQKIGYKVYLILRKNAGASETPAETVNRLFEHNPFTGIFDSDSSYDVNQRANYTILRCVKGTLPAAQAIQFPIAVGGENYPAPSAKTFSMGFKFKTPLIQRYTDDLLNNTVQNDMIMVFMADNGSSLANNTGIKAKFYANWYYQDA